MAEVRFYHVIRSSVDQALPELLEENYNRQLRAVVIAGSPERVEFLERHLWSYRADSFLPHEYAKTSDGKNAMIWLTHLDERPNDAEVLFLIDGTQSSRSREYQLVCDIFDGRDERAVAAARVRFKTAQKAGHVLTYWQQGPRGWEIKRSDQAK